MATKDPHRFVNELDDAAVSRLIARLESRAKDTVFTRLFDKYADHLALPPGVRVLEVGCGTGALIRALARRKDFSGHACGVDHSETFVKAAREFAAAEGIADSVEFQVGDAHALDVADASFDVVIAHTLISHVTDPESVVREMVRAVRPGGTVVIFDGDYASMTYAMPDHEFGQRMDAALVKVSFNNPRVMRDLPRLMSGLGLKLQAGWGDAVTEVGKGSYFKTFAQTYAPYLSISGLCPPESVDAWLQAQLQAIEEGTFFAACTYYTYIARREGAGTA